LADFEIINKVKNKRTKKVMPIFLKKKHKKNYEMSFALNRACATGDCAHLRCSTRPHTRFIINQFFKNDKTPKWVKVSKMEAYAQAKGWRLVTAEKIVDEITGINYRGVGSGRTYVWKQGITLPVWVALKPFPSPETEKEKVFKQRLVIIPMGDDQDAE